MSKSIYMYGSVRVYVCERSDDVFEGRIGEKEWMSDREREGKREARRGLLILASNDEYNIMYNIGCCIRNAEQCMMQFTPYLLYAQAAIRP